MAVVVALSTPNTEEAPDGTPRRIVSKRPSVEIEVVKFERNGNRGVPYFWAWDVSMEEFELALEGDPGIRNLAPLERTESGALYKAEWEVDSPIIRCMANAGGIVMQARGTAEEWRLKIWFEDGADASTFQRCCDEQDVPIEVTRLRQLADAVSEGAMRISDDQREALVLAHRAGYFEEPRGITQEELAEELDISASALGGRLRRGIGTLIEETLQ